MKNLPCIFQCFNSLQLFQITIVTNIVNKKILHKLFGSLFDTAGLLL